MVHHKLQDFDRTLKKVLDAVDDYLEETYGSRYRLHPARPPRGATSNKEQSGLFNVGTYFTPGYGSGSGKGYLVDIEIATLEDVPDSVEEEIDQAAAEYIQKLLPKHFPDRDLEVVRDGRNFKIQGDFFLGSV
jgi:hypothetical protein